MDQNWRGNPQIYYYLKKYQDDPASRVFAPLAESYRKAGLIDEAVEIAREGVRNHPNFVGGRVALARALFDRKSYMEVVHELESVVRDVPDNVIAQRLVADSFIMLNQPGSALTHLKMLLYLAPEDDELAKLVEQIETEQYTTGSQVLQNEPRLVVQDLMLTEPAVEKAAESTKENLNWQWKVKTLQNLLQSVTNS